MDTILVIDDDDDLRTSLVAALRINGWSVIEAANGVTGLTLAGQNQPDLVLCDVNMPDIDGYEVLRVLRSQSATSMIPVILMTGMTEENSVRHSMEQGADDYLPKPISAQSLVKAVKMRIERKHAVELKVQEVGERLLAIVDATPSLIAMLDATTEKLVYLNPAGYAMIGVGREEGISQITIQDCFQDTNGLASFKHYLKAAMLTGKWVGESRVVNRSGQTLPVEMQLLAHEKGSDKTTWLSIIAKDISEIILLRQAHKMEAVGRLAAGIAHEINTPIQYTQHNLHFIINSLGTIKQALANCEGAAKIANTDMASTIPVSDTASGCIRNDVKDLLDEIVEATNDALQGTERVSKIVRAMKEFSHPSGRNGEKPEPADLNQVIESTITVTLNEWKYVAEVVTQFAPKMPLVPIIAGEFSQVILNLLVNAAHAVAAATNEGSKGKGTITVSTKLNGDRAEVRIADTGTGISENVRHRIFEPFFTTKEIGKGTGQGLALARSIIVEKHKGDIYFETQTGQGTCFIIQLPLKKSHS